MEPEMYLVECSGFHIEHIIVAKHSKGISQVGLELPKLREQ